MAWLFRWLPAATMMACTVISYLDRNTLALLSPTILAETGLSTTDYGFAVSAYSVAFMLGNPLWGRVLDRAGLRFGMLCAVSIWTLASSAHALASSFIAFAALRALLGFGEGAAAPGGLRTVTQTLPASSRARGIALAYSGGSAGAILTPLLMGPIAAAYGWRAAFLATGAIGALWLGGFARLSLRPDLRGAPDAAANSPADDRGARPRWSDRRLWGFLAGYALGALPLGFVVYCAALYLHRALGLPQARIAHFLWIPPLGSELGVFFWGFLADRLARGKSRQAAVERLLPLAVVLALFLALVPYHHLLELTLLQFFFAMFVAAAFQVLVISHAADTFAASEAGYVAGLGSGAYGAGLALGMPLFGRLFDLGRYPLAFLLAALCPALGYACFRLCRGPLAVARDFE